MTDAKGCSSTKEIQITEPQQLLIQEQHGDVTCNDDNGTSDNGFIDITVSGGTGSYSYLWNTGETTQDISGLPAGQYTLDVLDAAGCSASITIQIALPDRLEVSFSAQDVTCNDDAGSSADGAIDLSVIGGTGTYQYSWSNGATTQDLTNLLAGTYTVTVTDAQGCTATKEVVISEPAKLQISETHIDLSCNDDQGLSNDGSIDVSVTGGTGNYTYSWSNGASTEDLTNLSPGNYSLTVEDQSGCSSSIEIIIGAPQQLVISETHQDITCNDDAGPSNDGSIDLTVSGGTGAYSFNWSNGATTADISDLAAGDYTVVVSDASGCQSSISVTINQPDLITMTVQTPDPVCQPSAIDLTATFTSNFTGTTTYFSDPALSAEVTDPQNITTTGEYFIRKVTAAGCQVVRSVQVTINPSPDLQASSVDALCNESSVDLSQVFVDNNNVPGEVTYWLDAAVSNPVPDPSDVRTSGTYYIQKITPEGCSDIEAFDINISILPNLVVTNPAPVCSPQTVSITSSFVDTNETVGTIFYWADPNLMVEMPNPDNIGESGTYYIQKVTQQGCSRTVSVDVTVHPLPELTINPPAPICLGETIDLGAVWTEGVGLGGTVSYALDKDFTIPVQTPAAVGESGRYYILFASDDGCSSSDSVDVVVGDFPDLVVTDPDAVCEGQSINLYDWVNDAANINGVLTFWEDDQLSIEITDGIVTQTGTYYVQKVSDLGCQTLSTIDVLVNKIPMLVVSGTTEVCEPNIINLENLVSDTNSTTGQLTFWQDEALSQPIPDPKEIASSGTYYVLKETVFGNCRDVATVDLS